MSLQVITPSDFCSALTLDLENNSHQEPALLVPQPWPPPGLEYFVIEAQTN